MMWFVASNVDGQIVREKDELGDSNATQMTQELLGALRENPLSCSFGVEIAENQMQDLIPRSAKLQHKLDSQPCRMSTVKGWP